MPNSVEIGLVVQEKMIFKICQCIFAFLSLSPLGNGRGPYLNTLDIPSSKDALCQVWLKLAMCFWRRGFFNVDNVFSQFCNNLPLENGEALQLNKRESRLPKDDLCQVW